MASSLYTHVGASVRVSDGVRVGVTAVFYSYYYYFIEPARSLANSLRLPNTQNANKPPTTAGNNGDGSETGVVLKTVFVATD